jgi:hypothetical protein
VTKKERRQMNSDCPHLNRLEVFLGRLRVRLHRRGTRSPARRADFIRVVLHVLNSLEHAQGFVDGATERRVVDGGVLDDTFTIDDEQTAERGAVFVEHVVRLGDLALEVRDERVLEVAETAVVAIGLQPRQVGKLGVDRAAEDFGVQRGEFLVAVGEGGDFRRADKGEIERVEEEHDVLAAVIGKLDVHELLVENRRGFKLRGLVANQRLARLLCSS